MGIINVKGIKESDGVAYKTIPAGIYNARITRVVEKTIKWDKDGKHHEVQALDVGYSIIDGDYANQRISKSFFLPKEATSDMSEQEVTELSRENDVSVAKLKAFITTCGLDLDADEFDTQDLVGIELRLSIVEKDKKGGEGKINQIMKEMPLG